VTDQRTGYLHLPALWVVDTPADTLEQVLHGDRDLQGAAGDVIAERVIAEGITGSFRRDGLALFEFTEPPYAEARGIDFLFARLTLVNAHLACLYASVLDIDGHGLERMTVTFHNAAHQRFDEPGTVYADVHTKALMKHDGYAVLGSAVGSVFHVEVTWVPSRRAVSAAAVSESLDRLAVLAQGGLEVLGRYEVLVRASVAAQVHDFASTVILSWAVIENAITNLWQHAVRELAGRLGGNPDVKPYKRLNAEATLNLLRTVGVLPDEAHAELNRVRVARNRWSHSLGEVTYEDAKLALSAASKALQAVDKTPWTVALEPASHGTTF
jgi:hypothetical protein